MIWGKTPVWRIGDRFDTAMVFDATNSGQTGLVAITVHTSVATHRSVPISEQDLTMFCIGWLAEKNILEPVTPDVELCLVHDNETVEYDGGAVCNMPRGHDGNVHREITQTLWAEWRTGNKSDRVETYEPPDVRKQKAKITGHVEGK